MKNLIIFFLLLTFCIPSQAQNFKKIDSLSRELIQRYNLKGIGIVAVKEDKIVYKNSFGKANKEKGFDDSTRIYIASNTKAFVGLAMNKLAQENKVNLEASITEYIPESYFSENINVESIQVKNLLTHTHGLSNDPLTFRTAYSGDYPQNLKKLLKFTVYQKDSLKKEFKYSNLGYLLSGMIIEKVTGKSWQTYLKEEILDPLDLDTTTPYIDFSRRLEALPYDFNSDKPINSIKAENTLHAAGGLYSTLSDMAKWLMLFTDRDQKELDKELIENYLDKNIADASENMGPFQMTGYGNGWIRGKFNREDILFHFGRFKGYESMISYKPKTDSGIFVFINERIGGVRIALMLTSYFYLLESENGESIKKEMEVFPKMIDPIYNEEVISPELFRYKNSQLLTGSYYNPKYGQLIVDKDSKGFTFTLGRLKSYAYKNPKDPSDIVIEWTPGIKEHFKIDKKEKVKLIYGDFGVFVKQ